MSEVADFFQSVKLPVMSEVAHVLIGMLNDDDVSSGELRGVIAKDPALTAKLLRLANSARYGVTRSIASIDDAIMVVGISQVRTLGLAACMADAFPVIPGLDRKEFWRNSTVTAGYANWLAASLGIDGQQAWLVGMMERLGELLIGQNQPAALARIEMQPHLPGGRWSREQELLGFSEANLSAELARRWNFPAEIVAALNATSDPMESHPFNRLGAVVHLACLLAETPDTDAATLDTLPQDVVDALRLDRDWMRRKFPKPESFFDISTL
ncbi:HDOD domain-containing protein [Noviherbaspirillum galbum]|uniref:HDOD domain-containing protein n=1 Tax=Noviherbaspirillum galbum TaxID=2709383 RepID=A0A6B3SYM8_9BURK|nr:HDOD domain-containing protein [Noviherbaspirillum galbum]NEX63159.1 HDOD domain-containing protein [Noviherbaspirillum galbum]